MHGTPVHIGAPEQLGIDDMQPDFGDAVRIEEGEIPVFGLVVRASSGSNEIRGSIRIKPCTWSYVYYGCT